MIADIVLFNIVGGAIAMVPNSLHPHFIYNKRVKNEEKNPK